MFFRLHSFSRQIFRSQSVQVTKAALFLPSTASFKLRLNLSEMSATHFLNRKSVVGSGQPGKVQGGVGVWNFFSRIYKVAFL